MKISIKPTEYLLVKAISNSEWDSCGFALIHTNSEWKSIQRKRLEINQNLFDDSNLLSLNYNDNKVDFYKFSDVLYPEIEKSLVNVNSAFVELNNEEINQFVLPENRLNGYQLKILKNGYAIYCAFGKYTGEEFWTVEFSIKNIL